MSGRSEQHSIECWVIRPSQGSWLVLLLHVPAVDRAGFGFWQPITGSVEPGETSVQACLREVQEETGLVVALDALTFLEGGLIFELPESDITIRKDLFVARVDAGEMVVLSTEHDDFIWAPATTVAYRLHWPSNLATWSIVFGHLTQKADSQDI